MLNNQHYNKHLTYDQRLIIENCLNNDSSMVDIANLLSKSPSSISKEIKRNRFIKYMNSYNRGLIKCASKSTCSHLRSFNKCFVDCVDFTLNNCKRTLRAPHVCNGCAKISKCMKNKYLYSAFNAQKSYSETLSKSRQGINITIDEIDTIEKIITPLIEKAQPINHIYATHKDELPFSISSFYNYIDKCVFSFRNIDLPRKVRIKRRKSSPRYKRDTKIRLNRTYTDFIDYAFKYPDKPIWEMDTVIGSIGGKVFLTLYSRDHKLLVLSLLDSKTTVAVSNFFEELSIIFGKRFSYLFPIILTDNGTEFSNPLSIEKFGTKIFYCDPLASYQKPGVENAHLFLRRILPKGCSFDQLTHSDTITIASNINNVKRDSLDGLSPYESFVSDYDSDTINLLGVYLISPDEVTLKKFK